MTYLYAGWHDTYKCIYDPAFQAAALLRKQNRTTEEARLREVQLELLIRDVAQEEADLHQEPIAAKPRKHKRKKPLKSTERPLRSGEQRITPAEKNLAPAPSKLKQTDLLLHSLPLQLVWTSRPSSKWVCKLQVVRVAPVPLRAGLLRVGLLRVGLLRVGLLRVGLLRVVVLLMRAGLALSMIVHLPVTASRATPRNQLRTRTPLERTAARLRTTMTMTMTILVTRPH